MQRIQALNPAAAPASSKPMLDAEDQVAEAFPEPLVQASKQLTLTPLELLDRLA